MALLLLPAPRDPSVITSAAVDGFVVYCLPADSEALGAVTARGLPYVLVEQAGGGDAPRVDIDDRAGAREAAAHLLSLGHERVGVLSLELTLPRRRGAVTARRERDATFVPPLNRLAGYREAVTAAGLTPSRVLRVVEARNNTPGEGELLALELLRAPDAPTALLCMSDQLALGALEAARTLGLSVPGGLSVVGFDDVPAAAVAGLTTVHQPTVEKGRLAGSLLLARLAGEEPSAPPALLPTRLVLRRTTGVQTS